MILKVKTVDYAGWKMYSGLTEINHWTAPLERMEKMGCDGRFISGKYHRETENVGELVKQKSVPAVVICVFARQGHEKNEGMIIFNTDAYILNDEGKTIEKI